MRLLAPAALLALLAPPTAAQETIDDLLGARPGDRLGAAVAFVGDLDHDGRADFAAGAPGDDTGGADAGSVTVFSGVDRSVLFRWDGSVPGGRLGESVDGVGDVDLDGFDDVLAGAPGADRALLFSGRTGAVLFDLAPGHAAAFGTSVAGLGRADGDAWPDFAVGATGGTGLWVFSGRTGGLHWSRPAPARDLGGLGDVDGDGFGDLLLGDRLWNGAGGRAVVYSGRTGAVLRQHLGDNTFQDQLGQGASGLGDVDGDGVGDYGYGVPCACFATHYAEVRSGATGALLHTLTKYTIGWDLAPAGDLDLDGTADVLVSEPGTIFAFSGADGGDLFAYGNGEVVDGGADADGDGYADVLAGAPGDATNGADAGRVSLYTLGCPYPGPVNYCAAAPNSTGLPAEIGWSHSTSIQQNDFRLFAAACPPNQFALFFYGPGEAYLPLGDGFRCVAAPLTRFDVVQTGPAGLPSWQVDFTDPPHGQISAGETWYFQLWFRDPSGGPAGNNLSDGLRVVFCP